MWFIITKNKTFFLFLFFSCQVAIPLFSDNTDDDWRKKNELFYLRSLSRELNNSDYNDLKQRAMSLGLDPKDTAGEYRTNIAEYYGIKLINEPAFSGDKIILERAGELKMFKLEKENEENLHIIGKAKIIINTKDNENKSVKREIEADEIFVDLKNKELSGIGSVKYLDDKLEFEGEQFYYNYHINRGALLRGKTKIKQKDQSGLDGALFIGEKITYLGEDESILYDGKLTTCNAEDPHYYIKVTRMWLNKDSEWGLQNGVAHIGPIPFLYIPIYYHPKNIDLNPSLGYRNREGWFLQTTYSLIGKTNESDSVDASTNVEAGLSKRRAIPTGEALFSITKSDIDKKLNEYYDKNPFYTKYPKLRILPELQKIDLSLKLFADAYTNIGFYYGGSFYLKLDHPKFPFEMNLITDYGFSRRLWKDTESDLYIPYNPADRPTDGDSKWNKNEEENKKNTFFYIEQNPLVFRTSQYLNFNGELFKNVMNFKYKGQLEYASDTSFFRDYYNRAYSFSYIDLGMKALTYNIEANEKGNSIFKTKEEEKASKITSATNFLSFSLSPNSIPDILGLRLLNNFSVDADNTINFTAESVPEYVPSAVNNAEDHRAERLFLDNASLPKLKISMSGTLLDYDVFTKMEEKAKTLKNTQKEEENTKEIRIEKALYENIERITTIDESTDKQKIDYKYLLPFFSKKLHEFSHSGDSLSGYYEKILSSDENQITGDHLKEEKKTEEKTYQTLFTFDKHKNIQNTDIRLINFNLNYSITDNYENKFLFYKKVEREKSEYDNVFEILTGNFDFNDRLMRFAITNEMSASVNGSFSLLKFSGANNPIFGLSPKFTFSYKKSWDNMDIFNRYLEKLWKNSTGASKENSILADRLAREYENRKNSEVVITYNEKLVNDLSFGNSFLQGTGIETTLNSELYRHNDQDVYNFGLLNDLNTTMGTAGYEKVAPENYFYRRGLYGFVKDLYSVFTLKLNFFPSDSPHKLDFGLGPKINYILPSNALNKLKTQLWNEESGSVLHQWDSIFPSRFHKTDVNRLTDQAKEYLYYRSKGKNLYDMISQFYEADRFWNGEKNYREMIENFSINTSYSYKNNNITIFSLSNVLTMNFVNMGTFSDGNGGQTSFGIYPNNSFSLSLFNSMLTYTMALTFTKEVDNKLLTDLTDTRRNLDEYNIMTFSNTHNAVFTLSGTLFDFKLPKGNWFSFTSSTDLRHNKNRKWQKEGDKFSHSLYLYSQTFKLNLLMDILSFNLTLKPYDYVDLGYQVAMESGNIKLSYNITEIPVLFRILKINLQPNISLVFSPQQAPFYKENGQIESYSQSYYDNNRLDFSFDIEAILGEKTDYETKIKFGVTSNNKKLYQYYDKNSNVSFFQDLIKSFNFANERDRRESSFNLQKILFSMEHKLHDWSFYFEYSGKPEKDYTGKKYIWENTFIFQVKWQIDSKNQLMKLFNKTKMDEKYEKGEWVQPTMSLDLNETE